MTRGSLNTGDILISNFNNAANVQGTGSTITRVTPQGVISTFFNAGPNHGLTNGLVMLTNGITIVGSLPTVNNVPQPGSIIFLDRFGKRLPLTINGGVQAPNTPATGELTNADINGGNRTGPNLSPIQGPWSMTLDDKGTGQASLYVSMVLSGTIQRFDFRYDSGGENVSLSAPTLIATGYTHKPDNAGLVLGPAGLFHFVKLDPKTGNRHDDLYVANSADNTIYLVNDAGWTTTTINQGTAIQVVEEVPDPNNPKNMIKVNPLHGPLGLTMTGKGNLVTANSDPAASMDPNHPSELIEFKTDGTFVSRLSIDPNNGGAFGVSIAPLGNAAMQLLFVNDNQVAMGKVTFSLMQ